MICINMHWIQKHIVDQLLYTDTVRFSQLRAEGVESNLFQYHLLHLIKQGIVEKVEGGYSLAPAGLYYADRFSSELKGERPQPKIITIAVIKNSEGKVFLQQKPRQPWVGMYHLPAGKIHAGETTDSAATREFEEKTGVRVENMYFRCLAHVQIFKSEQLISDYFGFIFSEMYEGEIGNGYWFDPDDTEDLMPLAPSVREVLALEKNGDQNFYPVTIDL